MRQFYQKRLALPWRDYLEDFKLEITPSGYRLGETWDDEAAVNRQGKFLTPPFDPSLAAAPLRFMTVDCQMDHFFVIVRGWSLEGSSRLVWRERVPTWDEVLSLQERFTIHSNLVFVDAGHATYDVYRECAERGWVALMGDRHGWMELKIPTLARGDRRGADIDRGGDAGRGMRGGDGAGALGYDAKRRIRDQ